MNNKRKEKISAFLDNDMHRDELMSFSLSADPDDAHGDARAAQRYQMIGDALRGEISDSSFVDISHAVREALLNENIFDETTVAKSAPLSDKRGLFNVSAWFRPVAGMAVAASVAVVMVVTLSGQETGTLTPTVANNDSQLKAQPVVRVAVDKSAVADKAVANKVTGNKATDIDQRLVNQHLEFATQDYVRAVSYEKKK